MSFLPLQPLAIVPTTGLLFGLLLFAAIAGGFFAHLLRLPRVIGYLAGGVAIKLLLLGLLDWGAVNDHHEALDEAAGPLKAIKDLALGLILFSIGGVFDARNIRTAGRRLLALGVIDAACTFALVFGGVLLISFMVGQPEDLPSRYCLAALLAIGAIATAPAATLFTLQEFEARGPTTETILSITGVNNVICIVLFHATFLILIATGSLRHVTLGGEGVWLGLLLTTFGSIVLGVALGFVVSLFHAQLRAPDALLYLIALFIVLSAGEGWLLRNEHIGVSYNFLLTSLVTGAIFANIAIDASRLENSIRTVGPPLFVGFFVLAGFNLHLADLAKLPLIGVAYLICRAAGKLFGGWLGMRLVGQPVTWLRSPGLGLLCQAAVVIGLADFVQTHWKHPYASKTFVTTVLGSVVVFEIVGPLLIKWLVVRSGEVMAVTLLRSAPPTSAGGSIFRLTLQALLRTLGLGPRAKANAAHTLTVREIMRTNVKCLPAAARFDEVLRFVEQSRFNHFPVIEENDRLVGVIHFSDIRGIMYAPALTNLLTAADLSASNTHAVPVTMTLEELLDFFSNIDFGSVPVVDSLETRRVVGVVEQRDLLQVLQPSRAKGGGH